MAMNTELGTLARALLDEAARGRGQLQPTIAVLNKAREEALAMLQQAASACPGPASRSLYETPARLLVKVNDGIVPLGARIGTILRESERCTARVTQCMANSAARIKVVDPSAASSAEAAAVARWAASLQYGLDAWTFFGAVPTLALAGLISSFAEVTVRFLGRDPGKRFDLTAGLWTLVDELGPAAIDAATFQIGTAVLKTLRVATTPPVKADIEKLSTAAVQIERVDRFRRLLLQLDAQSAFVGGLTSVSENAFLEAIQEIEGAQRALTDAVALHVAQ